MLPLAGLPRQGGGPVRRPGVRVPQPAFVIVTHWTVMGLATLLRAQRQRGGAGDWAGGTDHGAGPTLLSFFVAAPLHVGGGVVVRSRRTGYDGTDVVALPRTGRFLLQGWTLRREKNSESNRLTGCTAHRCNYTNISQKW